ncbi:MAG: hypothetical protein AABZ55_05120 [Bdellovibrionota bacterium]
MTEGNQTGTIADRKFRNRFLIFPKFQLILIGMNLVTMLLIAGIVWFQINRAFSELRVMGAASGMEVEFYNKFLAFQSGTIEAYLFSGLFLGIILSVAMTVAVSHRFAGPLVRLRGFFNQLKGCVGTTPRLSFRRGDFLSDLPPIINEAIQHIETRPRGTAKQAENVQAENVQAEAPRLRAVK